MAPPTRCVCKDAQHCQISGKTWNRRHRGKLLCTYQDNFNITADGDCSHEIKRHLLLGREAMTNLDSILQSRDITLTTKVCIVKTKRSYDQPRQYTTKQRHHFDNKGLYSQNYSFPAVTYGCESWTIKRLSTEELMLLNCGVGEDS